MNKSVRNSLIVAGIAMLTTMTGIISYIENPMLKIIISAFIGFGITFMIEYAHECNIKPITREKKACKTLTKTTFFF